MLEVAEKRVSTIRKKKISFEDFLTKFDGKHAEWIDGEVIEFMSASDKHQDLVRFFTVVLGVFIEEKDLGIIRTAPMTIRLSERGREPDLFFVAKNRLDKLKKTYFDGSPDLIIEIISPESRGRDRGDKFYEYEIAGVCEYWIIDYEREKVEFYNLDKDGFFQMVYADETNTFHSQVLPNLRLNVSWLWQEKLPNLLQVLKEWELVKQF